MYTYKILIKKDVSAFYYYRYGFTMFEKLLNIPRTDILLVDYVFLWTLVTTWNIKICSTTFAEQCFVTYLSFVYNQHQNNARSNTQPVVSKYVATSLQIYLIFRSSWRQVHKRGGDSSERLAREMQMCRDCRMLMLTARACSEKLNRAVAAVSITRTSINVNWPK